MHILLLALFLIGFFAVICQCIGGLVDIFKTVFPYAFGVALVVIIFLCIFF